MERTFTIETTPQVKGIGFAEVTVIEKFSRPIVGLLIAILIVFAVTKFL